MPPCHLASVTNVIARRSRLLALLFFLGIAALFGDVLMLTLLGAEWTDEFGLRCLSAQKQYFSSTFTGRKTRSFEGTNRRQNGEDGSYLQSNSATPPSFPKIFRDCEQWAVTTTNANLPTDAIRSVAKLPDWCLLVISDQEVQHEDLNSTNVLFLSTEQLRQIHHPFVKRMLLENPSRKNIGYLVAIRHGARVVYEFDDINVLVESRMPMGTNYPMKSKLDQILVRYAPPSPTSSWMKKQCHAYNPLPHMKPRLREMIWPRGFPLSGIADSYLKKSPKKTQKKRLIDADIMHGSINLTSVAVIQALCNGDPDIENICRSNERRDIYFDTAATKFMIPPGKFAPYNSQATTHMYDAFWGLFLPFSVTSRVADIWRSYAAQRIFYDLGLVVLFEPPLVEHSRSERDNLDDRKSQDELYTKTSKLLEFLSTWKPDREAAETLLPARIERLWVALYERGYIELDDVHAMQEWLATLLEIGYKFPSLPQAGKLAQQDTQLSTSASSLIVTPQPFLHRQGYLASPIYNVGFNGLRYPEFLLESNVAGTKKMFKKWLKGVKEEVRPSNETIIKLIVMSKDEWPLLKQWVLYHGELLGFQHLYVVDGSTDKKTVEFLRNARDHLGVNVVFSKAGLNSIGLALSAVAREISRASDFIIKLDVDEFLVGNTGSPECRTTISPAFLNQSDCTLSPYAWNEAVHNLRKNTNYGRMRIGWQQVSKPRLEVCKAGHGDEPGLLQFREVSPAKNYKAIADSKTVMFIDLGGHSNSFEEPFSEGEEFTNAAVVHVHFRCLEHEVLNTRKACVSHGFFGEEDTPEVVLQNFLQSSGLNMSQVCGDLPCEGGSCHKKLFYIRYIAGCLGEDGAQYYDDVPGSVNPDFQAFLDKAVSKYWMS